MKPPLLARDMTRRAIVGAVLLCGAATPLHAQSLTGTVQTVTVARGDTLRSLGSRFGIDPATIAADNARTVDATLHAGDVLSIDNRHIIPWAAPEATILVNVPQRMLFLRSDAGVMAYPVAVGRSDWPTPLGNFSVVSKEVNPTWDVPDSIREEARRAGRSLPRQVPPGPSNPLGAHWLGLSLGSVGLHGTNAPTSIYRVTTHGCIRLHPADVAALFDRVLVGMKGIVLYEPLLLAVHGDEVFLEAHRDVYRRGPREALEWTRTRAHALGVYADVDWELAARVITERAGVARAVTR